jgi:hypothetical protein
VTKRVYVHLGLPKTGTTYLQAALWAGRNELAEDGCLIPGQRRASAWRAASDLLGRRPKNAEARDVSGAWRTVSRQIRQWTGDRVVFSEELLSTANPRQIRRLVSSLGDAEVHAVVTVRDLMRVLPSLWQQEVRKGGTWTWSDFLDSVEDPRHGSVKAAAAFWLRFDLVKILGTWAEAVTPERVHVVVLPPSGSPPSVLVDRFASVVGIDGETLQGHALTERSNVALGRREVEALRRLNVVLGSELNERQYARIVVKGVIPILEARSSSSPRVMIPLNHRPWVEKMSDEIVQHLRTSSYDVVGDLDDLLPGSMSTAEAGIDAVAEADPAEVDDAELVDPLLDALAVLATTHAHRWWKNRPEEVATAGMPARLGSATRAATYKVRARVLEKSEHNRALRWLTLTYLRRRR